MTSLLIVHLVATAYMTGLIWLVQVVHYPLMSKVGQTGYVDYQRAHMRLITPVVLPAMLTELATATWIAVAIPGAMSVTGAALAVMIWVSTFALQVPCHAKLEKAFDPAVHRRLVRTNWVRTVLWSARCVLAGALLAGGFGG